MAHRAGERFAMCSTFKLPARRACTRRPAGARAADESFTRADLLSNSPYSEADARAGRRRLDAGRLRGRACDRRKRQYRRQSAAPPDGRAGGLHPAPARAAATRSPASTATSWRSTRMRRGDPRDTTSPAAMARTREPLRLRQSACTRPGARNCRGWMIATRTGAAPHPRRPARGLAGGRQDRHLRHRAQRRRLPGQPGRPRIYARRLSRPPDRARGPRRSRARRRRPAGGAADRCEVERR